MNGEELFVNIFFEKYLLNAMAKFWEIGFEIF